MKAEAQARFDVQKEADRIVLSQYAPAGLIVNENLQILHFRGQTSPYLSPSAGRGEPGPAPHGAPGIRRGTAHGHSPREEAGDRRSQGRHPGPARWPSLGCPPGGGSDQGRSGERFFLVLFQETPVREPAGPEATDQSAGQPAGGSALEDARLRGELQTTKENLQSIIQEQEAINEELKSANEEALSSNEELQSTNEELETAKEELQSANEELVTVNEQLQNRNFGTGAAQRRSHQPAQQRQHPHPDAEWRLAHPAFHPAGRKTAEPCCPATWGVPSVTSGRTSMCRTWPAWSPKSSIP